jgi:hypothetical protein
MGWRDDNAVGKAVRPALVMHEDGERERGGRGVAVARVRQHAHLVGGEHLQGGDEGGLGQRVGVPAQVERTGDARVSAVLTDRLRGGGNVIFVEGQPECRPPVARGAERDLLPGLGRVRVLRVVRRHQRGHIDQVGIGGWLAGTFVRFHPHLPTGRPAVRFARRRPGAKCSRN